MSLNPLERETVINLSDGDDTVRIWTAQQTTLRRLRGDARFTEVESGVEDGTEHASFTIPKDQWNPVSGAKRQLSVAEKARRAQILSKTAGKAEVLTV